MRKLITATLTMLALGGCTIISVDPGQEAVIVRKPLIFGKSGVDSIPVSTGITYSWLSTSYILYNIQPQIIKEKFDDLMSADNVPVDIDIQIQVKKIPGTTPKLHTQFGLEWYENNLRPFVRNQVRDMAKVRKMMELTTDPTVVTSMEKNITESVRNYVKQNGLPIQIMETQIGRVNPPKGVLDEIERTASQTQRSKTESEREKAEIQRGKAEIQRAIADKAYRSNFGLSNQEYIQLKQLEHIDGKNSTIIMQFGQGPAPILLK